MTGARVKRQAGISPPAFYIKSNLKEGADLFEGLDIWQYPEFQEQQGKWPVLFLSFADVKESRFEETVSVGYS